MNKTSDSHITAPSLATVKLLRALATLGPRLHEPFATTTPQTLSTLVCDTLRSCGLFAHVSLLDQENRLVILGTSFHPLLEHVIDRLLKAPIVGYAMPRVGVFGEPLERGETMVVEDSTTAIGPLAPHLSPRQLTILLHTAGVERLIVAPLLARGRLIGALSVWGRSKRLAGEDAPAVGALAAQMGIALENARLFQEAEQARALAEEATRKRDEFLSLASHELKTPLTGVRGSTQLAQRYLEKLIEENHATPQQAEQLQTLQRFLRNIDIASKRLQRMANDLLDATRAESNKMHLSMDACDLEQICRQTVEEQRDASRVIETRWPGASVWVEADPDRISQVLANLLSNALKFSSPHQPVSVSLTTADGSAAVRVSDHGPGLPEAEHERIFERFHQAPDITIQSGSQVGLGLGLYISRQIIEQHGGRLWVESRPGQGATFTFSLPLMAMA